MRRVVSYTILMLFIGATFSKWGTAVVAQKSEAEVETKKELVDIKADVVYPHKLGPDSSVLCLVGNFAAQHHGAIITADSAVRYSDERIDCFGNVLINKNTTYAYADRAIYNGAINEVELFSPVIKVVDEDVTLYTYNFKFNTLDNIGEYWGGGVTTNQDSSRLESMRGFYYSDSKDVIGVNEVEIFTTEYEMKGDSVRYNMQSNYAEFFERSNIWDSDGGYLYTNRGDYDKTLALFTLTRDGYMLSGEHEAWSDSMEYFKDLGQAIFRSNIQIDDTTNMMLIYSDFAHYWDEDDKIFLTQKPSIVNYDPMQSDTMFMRADTIILTTHYREGSNILDIIPPDTTQVSTEGAPVPAKEERGHEGHGGDKEDKKDKEPQSQQSKEFKELPSIQPQLDSIALLMQDSLITKEERGRLKAEAKKIKADSISLARSRERAIKMDAQRAREERLKAQREEKMSQRSAQIAEREALRAEKLALKQAERAAKRGKDVECDSCDHDHHHHDHRDTLLMAFVDSMNMDNMSDSLASVLYITDTLPAKPVDSVYRIIVGFRDARTLQGVQQTASDSMSMNLKDTTMHLYINPYMWNAENQATSDVMDIYTIAGELDRAVFTGNPIMASMIDTTHYNQVAGRVITSIFKENALVRNEVEGNVRTIYFMQDDQTFEITTMTYVESGTATFFFVEGELDGITYRAEPVYTFFPMHLIPATQSKKLDNFVWEGRQRPTREDFTDRYRRPSIREQKEALPRPKFPIQSSILIEMDILTQDKMWVDRDDKVPTHAEEWLESLGYKSGQPREDSK